jgi:8-oxo-dGTP pyrophosphatase MutT (NUDIX family)
MNFKIWLESDEDHRETLKKTGFWGKQGAGSIVLAKSTGRILLPHRSSKTLEPNTWGVWGGAIDGSEDPQTAAKRELQEEAGYSGFIKMVPLSVFQKDNFKYHNFLAIVDEEFTPNINWETQNYVWTTIDELPHPLHFGLAWLLSKDTNKIKSLIHQYSSPLTAAPV